MDCGRRVLSCHSECNTPIQNSIPTELPDKNGRCWAKRFPAILHEITHLEYILTKATRGFQQSLVKKLFPAIMHSIPYLSNISTKPSVIYRRAWARGVCLPSCVQICHNPLTSLEKFRLSRKRSARGLLCLNFFACSGNHC